MVRGTPVRSAPDKVALTRAFWNANPCDGQASYAKRAQFRYRKDPWLLGVLDEIAGVHRNILEVGCGQGTDGLTLCGKLQPGSKYTGVDLSDESLARARAARGELAGQFDVEPVFQLEDAERLSFADGQFDCVLSIGALHHSAGVERAIAEARRVLAPGGVAYVALYRRASPKVLGAHALRGVQRVIDTALRTQSSLYRGARALGMGDRYGTAIYECFGVPVLRSYTRDGMLRLFREFSSVELSAHGRRGPGYLWLARAVK
jgi:SAM-dependent methyltransferase